MKQRFYIGAMCAIVIVLLTVGCRNGKQPEGILENPSAQTLTQIVPLNGLDEVLRFGNLVENSGPPYSISLTIRSLNKEKPIYCQFSVQFFDAAGRTTNPNEEWFFLSVPPLIETNLVANAISDQAVSWRLVIREAK